MAAVIGQQQGENPAQRIEVSSNQRHEEDLCEVTMSDGDEDRDRADEEEGKGGVFDDDVHHNVATSQHSSRATGTVESLADSGAFSAPPVEPHRVVERASPTPSATTNNQHNSMLKKKKTTTRTGLAGNSGPVRPGAFAASPMLEDSSNANSKHRTEVDRTILEARPSIGLIPRGEDSQGNLVTPNNSHHGAPSKNRKKSIVTANKLSGNTNSDLIPGAHEMVAAYETKQLGKTKGMRDGSRHRESGDEEMPSSSQRSQSAPQENDKIAQYPAEEGGANEVYDDEILVPPMGDDEEIVLAPEQDEEIVLGPEPEDEEIVLGPEEEQDGDVFPPPEENPRGDRRSREFSSISTLSSRTGRSVTQHSITQQSIISRTSTGNFIQAVLVEEPQEVPSSNNNQPTTMEVFNAVQVDPKENDPDSKPLYAHKHFKYWAGGIFLVLTLTVIIAVSVTARSGSTAQFTGATNAPSATPSMAPITAGPTTLAPTAESSNYEPIHQLVGHFVEDPSQLSNSSSPYYEALRWLVYTDELDPNSMDFDYEKMQQRYILALFYYGAKAKNDPNSWLACNPPTGNETTECIHKAFDGQATGNKNADPVYANTTSTRWLTSIDECYWAGLYCDGWGKVYRIVLGHYNLAGTLPNELGLLTELAELDVETDNDGDFRLTGTLPTFVALLPHLERLVLSGNRYPGTIPDELCDATSLVALKLSNVNVRGTIPTCLGRLTNLWRLELDDNRLTGTIPTELNLLTGLHEVELHKNSITGTVPSGGILCNLERDIKVDCKSPNPDITCPEDCFCDC